MSGVNRALARIKKSGKRYDPENGGKSIRTDLRNDKNSNHVSAAKQMGRSMKRDFGSTMPVPMTPERDRQKRRKIHETGEHGCLGSDSQAINKSCQKKITLLQKEKESFSCENVMPNMDNDLISPSKVLRVALMKKRFGDLISKANHQLVMSQGDPLKLQQEKERLQMERIAEKAKIEQQIKAAETLLRIRAEAESKLQRQREREAARISLEKMERTVEFNDALQTMRDFESLLSCVC